jgi:hypothetical protein
MQSEERIDCWWGSALVRQKYPVLCKVALALLTPFHGPQIESSFNIMGGILSSKAPTTAVETYESYQCVKYHLKNANQSAKEMFHREDVKNSAVDTTLAHNLRSASASYRAKLKSKNKA